MTNLELIDTLPVSQEVKEKITNNIPKGELNENCTCYGDNLHDWLASLFIWKDTPEGHDYWSKMASDLIEQK